MGKVKTDKANGGQESPSLQANSVEMRIPASAEWVRVVRLATAGVAARLGFSYDDIEDLKLAVAEACNNAILHGSALPENGEACDPGVTVTVRWTILPDRLKISVTDQGRLGEAGLKLPEVPESAADDLKEGGMGLILIQTLMDEVEHESGPHADTTLHMTKMAPPVRTGSPALRPTTRGAVAPAKSSDTPASRQLPARGAGALSKALRDS